MKKIILQGLLRSEVDLGFGDLDLGEVMASARRSLKKKRGPGFGEVKVKKYFRGHDLAEVEVR